MICGGSILPVDKLCVSPVSEILRIGGEDGLANNCAVDPFINSLTLVELGNIVETTDGFCCV